MSVKGPASIQYYSGNNPENNVKKLGVIDQQLVMFNGNNGFVKEAPSSVIKTSITTIMNTAAHKAVPDDTDLVVIIDKDTGAVLSQLTFAELKASLKTYFDTLYTPIS